MRTRGSRMRSAVRTLAPALYACANSPGGEARKSIAHAQNSREATARAGRRMRVMPQQCWSAVPRMRNTAARSFPPCAHAQGSLQWGQLRGLWAQFILFYFVFPGYA